MGDRDGRGYLSRDAFMEILDSPYQVRRLQQAINQPLADVRRIFDWLDVDGKGYVRFPEFCEGLDCLEQPVTGQRLLKVDSGIKLQCSHLQKNIDSAAAEVHDLQVALKNQHAHAMRVMRSTSSLRSFGSTGTPKQMRLSKSVSFSEGAPDIAEVLTE